MRIRIGEKYSRDLTNLDLMGRGDEEWVGECLQFVQQF